jgi:hypothetical protein
MIRGRHRLGHRAQRVAPWPQLTAVSTAASSPASQRMARSGPATSPPGLATWSLATSPPMTLQVCRPVAERLAGIGVELTGLLTNNGPEFTGRQFTAAPKRGLRHHQIPHRSPNHNTACERFQSTALQGFYGRPSTAGSSLAWDRNAQFQGWLRSTTPPLHPRRLTGSHRPDEATTQARLASEHLFDYPGLTSSLIRPETCDDWLRNGRGTGKDPSNSDSIRRSAARGSADPYTPSSLGFR